MHMRMHPFAVLVGGGARVVAALVTLETVREVAAVTRECTVEIVGRELAGLGREAGVGVGAGVGRGGEEVVVVGELGRGGGWDGDGDGDGDEMEDVIAAALAVVDGKVLEALNVPLDTEVEPRAPKPSCTTIKAEYHMFLGATTRFIHAIQERQMANRWGGESLIYHNLAYMQALWASPTKNEQNKSFIEQQMTLYSSTGCFGKSKEVLLRSVEVVEYMNDVIDTFGN